jgi:hypothetical protein
VGHIAIPQLAIELPPLLVIDGRVKILGWIGDSLDTQDDPKIALRGERKTALSGSTEQLKLHDCSLPVEMHAITLPHAFSLVAASGRSSFSARSVVGFCRYHPGPIALVQRG